MAKGRLRIGAIFGGGLKGRAVAFFFLRMIGSERGEISVVNSQALRNFGSHGVDRELKRSDFGGRTGQSMSTFLRIPSNIFCSLAIFSFNASAFDAIRRTVARVSSSSLM
jgi:hypothetical protein